MLKMIKESEKVWIYIYIYLFCFFYLLCEAEMKESISGAEMVAHKSKAPTPKPAISLVLSSSRVKCIIHLRFWAHRVLLAQMVGASC
jgi:hypothetical protein